MVTYDKVIVDVPIIVTHRPSYDKNNSPNDPSPNDPSPNVLSHDNSDKENNSEGNNVDKSDYAITKDPSHESSPNDPSRSDPSHNNSDKENNSEVKNVNKSDYAMTKDPSHNSEEKDGDWKSNDPTLDNDPEAENESQLPYSGEISFNQHILDATESKLSSIEYAYPLNDDIKLLRKRSRPQETLNTSNDCKLVPKCANCHVSFADSFFLDESPIMSMSCCHTICYKCCQNAVLSNRKKLKRPKVNNSHCPIKSCLAKNAFRYNSENFNSALIDYMKFIKNPTFSIK